MGLDVKILKTNNIGYMIRNHIEHLFNNLIILSDFFIGS